MEIRRRTEVVTVFVDDGVVYIDSPANFEADFGMPAPALPEGRVELSHKPFDKITVYFDAKQNAFPEEGAHELEGCSALLAKCADAVVNKGARERAAFEAQKAKVEAEVEARRLAGIEAVKLPESIPADTTKMPVRTIG